MLRKVCIMMTVLLLSASAVYAGKAHYKTIEDANKVKTRKEAQQLRCAAYGDIAEVLVEKRDSGVPLSAIMEIIDDSIIKTLAIKVYEYSVLDATYFRADIEVQCYKQIN